MYIYVFLLRMTYIITSQNIDLSSRDSLYIINFCIYNSSSNFSPPIFLFVLAGPRFLLFLLHSVAV
jgi:hypothetical protein